MDDITRYICNYIFDTFPNVSELEDKNYCFSIAKEIRNNHPNTNFALGKYDFYINECISSKLKNSSSFAKYKDVKNHVYMSIVYYETVNNLKIEDSTILLNEIVRRLYNGYSYEDIISNKCDLVIESLIEKRDVIISLLKKKSNDKPIEGFITKEGNEEDYTKQYILDYLLKYRSVFKCDNLRKTAINIYDNAIKLGIDPDDIILGKHNDFIVSNIKNSKNGIILNESINDINKYVQKYISNHTNKVKNKRLLMNESFKISMDIMRNGFNKDDVLNGKSDKFINKSARYVLIKANSVINDEQDRISVNKKHTMMSAKTKAIILASTMTIMVGALSYKNFDNVSTEPLTIESIDDYAYPVIPSEMSNEFGDATENVLDTYNDYIQYGDVYGQLAFLRVYNSFAENKFHGVDSMFSLLREEAKIDEENTKLFEEMDRYYCYPVYVYNKLIEAGVNEINNNEYYTAVKLYDNQYANYKLMRPFDLLSKDNQKTLNKMMKIYEKYCNELSEQLVNEINDDLISNTKSR